jgi:hypothetical protein
MPILARNVVKSPHQASKYGRLKRCRMAPERGRTRERVRGIEPPPKAWEAFILPLNYTRDRPLQPGSDAARCDRETTSILATGSIRGKLSADWASPRRPPDIEAATLGRAVLSACPACSNACPNVAGATNLFSNYFLGKHFIGQIPLPLSRKNLVADVTRGVRAASKEALDCAQLKIGHNLLVASWVATKFSARTVSNLKIPAHHYGVGQF